MIRSSTCKPAFLAALAALSTCIASDVIAGGLGLIQRADKTAVSDADPAASAEPGSLEAVAQAMPPVFRLRLDGNMLKLACSDQEKILEWYHSLHGGAGLHSVGSSYGGNTMRLEARSMGTEGPAVRFLFTATERVPDSAGESSATRRDVVLSIRQLSERGLELEITQREPREINIVIRDRATQGYYRLRQVAGQKTTLVSIGPDTVHWLQAADFADLLRHDTEKMHEPLFAMLGKFGLGELVSPWSASVRDGVFSAILPWSEEDRKRAAKWLPGLDSASFEERHAATRKLEVLAREATAEDRQFLIRIATSIQFNPEVRARTLVTIRNALSETDLETITLICRLLDNPDSLAFQDLMAGEPDPVRRQAMENYLASIGNRAPSRERADAPLPEAKPGVEPAVPENGPAAPEGAIVATKVFERHRPDIATLIHLDWKENQIGLDRQHWKVPFDGKAIADLVEEVHLELRKRNLPHAWFSARSTVPLRTTRHPQVLFERLAENAQQSDAEWNASAGASPMNMPYSSSTGGYVHQSFNREMAVNSFSAGLSFHDVEQLQHNEIQNFNLETAPFRFSIADREGAELMVEESSGGIFTLMLIVDSSDYMVRLAIRPDSAIVHRARNGIVQKLHEPHFRALLEKHPEILREEILPALQQFGVGVDEAFAPPEQR